MVRIDDTQLRSKGEGMNYDDMFYEKPSQTASTDKAIFIYGGMANEVIVSPWQQNYELQNNCTKALMKIAELEQRIADLVKLEKERIELFEKIEQLRAEVTDLEDKLDRFTGLDIKSWR
jgi:hypothetical protein